MPSSGRRSRTGRRRDGANASRHPPQVAVPEAELAAGVARGDRRRVDAALKLAPIVVPYAMLLVLVAIYGSVGSSVLTLQELNIQAAAVMTLLLVAAGQTIVILLGGIDLSVGGIVSLTTALAATRLDGHGIGSLRGSRRSCCSGRRSAR